jgi:hypothetical protein
MTYVLQGMRSLSMEGWDMGDLAVAFLAVGILGVVTISLAFMALKSRIS